MPSKKVPVNMSKMHRLGIILHMCKVSSESLLSVHTFCTIQGFFSLIRLCGCLVHLCSLIRASVVRTCQKTHFHMAQLTSENTSILAINLSQPRWPSWMHRPTGDQEVGGSTPAEVGNILSWRLIMKYFLRSFSPFR